MTIYTLCGHAIIDPFPLGRLRERCPDCLDEAPAASDPRYLFVARRPMAPDPQAVPNWIQKQAQKHPVDAHGQRHEWVG